MTSEPKKKDEYKPKKSIGQYTDTELIDALKNSHLISELKLAPVSAEILKRMNERFPLLPERVSKYNGPIC